MTVHKSSLGWAAQERCWLWGVPLKRIQFTEVRYFSKQIWRSTMLRGTVKWFDTEKRYEAQDHDGKDVFVDISAVVKHEP
jgi:hypothetical protein